MTCSDRSPAREFTDIHVMELGSDVRRTPKISGTTHNIFGIQTGVAIAFLVRDKSRLGECNIHYARREDVEVAKDKLAYLGAAAMQDINFDAITPDEFNQWLNQSIHGFRFRQLMPVADRQTKLAKSADEERAVFRLFANAVKSNRDDWVYDFDAHNLRDKALFFVDAYNGFLAEQDKSYNPVIKWSSSLRDRFHRGETITYNDGNRVRSLWRPFIVKSLFAEAIMNDRLTRNHYEMFGSDLQQPNKVINFCTNGKDFYVLATNKPSDFHFTGDTQCLPVYRYIADGERVSNITDWAVREFNEHCRDVLGDYYQETYGGGGITAEDIFAYTYAVLHDPVYRHDYGVDLLR